MIGRSLQRKKAISVATLLSYLLVLLLSAATINTAMTSDVFAQEKKRKTLMDLFFNKKQKPAKVKKPRIAKKTVKKTQRLKKTRKVARAAGVAAPKAVVREKLENARIILVIGDFTSGGMAEGLEVGFAD